MLPNKPDLQLLNESFSDVSQYLQCSYLQKKINNYGFVAFLEELSTGLLQVVVPLENGMILRIANLKNQNSLLPLIEFSDSNDSNSESNSVLFNAKMELISFGCDENQAHASFECSSIIEASLEIINQSFSSFFLGGIYQLVFETKTEIYPHSIMKELAI